VLQELFPGELCTTLPEADATRQRVRQELGRHRWVHFSCHGDQDLNDPSQGGVWLTDGMLTIADLTAEQFDGDFAGLSACKTAIGGIDLLDEAITLAAALHYLGYRHVVATLWSVNDKHTSEVFTSIYRKIAADGKLQPDLAPAALHEAVRALRDTAPEWPHQWTPFTHTGP
jgi:CHAT domain-containing protein